MIMSELPGELLEEILCRVPAPSLKQLRSTCKQWNRLFNDARFRRKHFDIAAKQSMILMLKESKVCSKRINLHRIPHVELIGKQLNLVPPHSSLGQVKILKVFHCNGLLLCVTHIGLVVWNPCTGQTRWIDRYEYYATYALGSYQDKKSNDISYKILRNSSYGRNQEFRIYEINSNSWRILDVTVDFIIVGYLNRGASLKGKTYWIARDKKEVDMFLLVSFDYTRERFERLCLPPQYPSFQNLSLSVVREEKLSVLLQREFAWKTEIWVTKKISETKGVTWSMVLAVNLGPRLRVWKSDGHFWIDEEEKKVLVYCDNLVYKAKTIVHIVGEDNKVKQVDFVVESLLFDYVPSLIQI